MNALEKWIVEDMIERLDDLEDMGGSVSDITFYLYESDNYNGVISGYAAFSDVKKWIDKYWDDLGKEMEEYKFNVGEYLNPFEDAHMFMVKIVLEVAGRLISKSEWVRENWNKELGYTADVLKQIKKELQEAIEG